MNEKRELEPRKKKRKLNDEEVPPFLILPVEEVPPFLLLPVEVVAIIFSFLTNREVRNNQLVCSLFKVACQEVARLRMKQVDPAFVKNSPKQSNWFFSLALEQKNLQRFTTSILDLINVRSSIIRGSFYSPSEHYYGSLEKALGTIAPFRALKSLLELKLVKPMELGRSTITPSARMVLFHYFIGTMDYKVINQLLKKGFCPNSIPPTVYDTKFEKCTPVFVLMDVISSDFNSKRGDLSSDLKLLQLLLDHDADFCTSYNSTTIPDLVIQRKETIQPSCLSTMAYLYLKKAFDKPDMMNEEKFIIALGDEQSKIYLSAKANLEEICAKELISADASMTIGP